MINNLRFFCQRVLPVVYDDSLSFQELLYKVIYKLNEIIPVVNDFGDTLEEKVSEILQEWLEDGTLEDIIDNLTFEIMTPEMFGAKGDGVTDDTEAFKDAAASGKQIVIPDHTYLINEEINFGDKIIEDYGTYADYKPMYEHAVNVNFAATTPVFSAALPDKSSYDECGVYFNDNYYIGVYVYGISTTYTKIVRYDDSMTQIMVKDLGNTYGRINNLWKDDSYIYADFDSGQHVKFDAELNVISTWTNTAYRNFGYYNHQYYGLAFSANNLTVTRFSDDFTTAGESFTVTSPFTEILQSATIINGVIYIPTTLGEIRTIDLATRRLNYFPYDIIMEIESFMEKDNEVMAVGHDMDVAANVKILSFKGSGYRSVPSTEVDCSNSNINTTVNTRSGIYKVSNGTDNVRVAFPEDDGTFVNLNDFRIFTTPDGKIYNAASANMNYIGRLGNDAVRILGTDDYRLVFEATTSGNIALYCADFTVNADSQTFNYDLTDFYDRYNINPSRVFHGSMIGHQNLALDQFTTGDTYVAYFRVSITGVTMLVKNLTNPGTVSNCNLWGLIMLI